MTAPFASGAVYVDSLQDKLSVQAFYNTNLLRIIRELVIGQAEDGEYSEYVLPSHLTFTRVPPQFHGKSFIQLFHHLMLKNLALPIAVYRSAPWGEHVSGSQMPYVLTNPTSDLLMNSNDFLYTLDSKMAGDSVMEVCVLRGRNFGSFTSRPGGWACKVQAAESGFITPAAAGSTPVWDCIPFCLCLHKNAWPLQLNFTVLAKFENKHGKREQTAGSGQLVLSHPSELGERFADKFWVELEVLQTALDEDDEACENSVDQQQNKSLTKTDHKPAIHVLITYSHFTAGEEPCVAPRAGGNTSGDERDAESQDTSAASILSERLGFEKGASKRELEKEREREQVQTLVLEELSRTHSSTVYPSETVMVPRAHAHHAQHVAYIGGVGGGGARDSIKEAYADVISLETVEPKAYSSDTVIVPRNMTPHTMTGNIGTESVFFPHPHGNAHHAQPRREADIDANMIILATEELGSPYLKSFPLRACLFCFMHRRPPLSHAVFCCCFRCRLPSPVWARWIPDHCKAGAVVQDKIRRARCRLLFSCTGPTRWESEKHGWRAKRVQIVLSKSSARRQQGDLNRRANVTA
jgi:hypothetical protein